MIGDFSLIMQTTMINTNAISKILAGENTSQGLGVDMFEGGKKGNTNNSGTNSTYNIATTTSADAGHYYVKIFSDLCTTGVIAQPEPNIFPFSQLSNAGISCRMEDTSSQLISSGRNSDIKIYPNPNDGTFTVYASEFEGRDVEIEIFNSLSLIVYRKQLNNFIGYNKLSIGKGSRGLLYLRIHDAEKSLTTKFIVNEE